MDDKDNKRFFNDKKLLGEVQTTKKVSEVNMADYSAIVFAGGHGTMWDFSEDKSIKKAITEVYENGGVVGALCHGPAALVDVKLSNGDYLVKGKNIAVFTDKEEEIRKLQDIVPYALESKLVSQGGISKGTKPWGDAAVADKKTSNWPKPSFSNIFW